MFRTIKIKFNTCARWARYVKGGGVPDFDFDFVWRLCATRYEAVGFV
ncbi:MAG: hypothetical protein LBH93_06770 [Chitinispirillales bacterium]|nr:hypothetical protein [Chitinispirillales bacterium]